MDSKLQRQEANEMKVIWEKIKSENIFGGGSLWRSKVPGGWIIRLSGNGEGLAFYPDPEHKWDGNSLP
jgi:hypothetical protein